MKKEILYSALALATTFGLSSCGDSFLTIDAAGSVSEATLTNDQGIDFVLTGAYSTLNGMFDHQWDNPSKTLANPIFGDILGGDANKASTLTDQPQWLLLETYSITESNLYVSTKWGSIYEAIRRANSVLSMVNKAGDTLTNPDLIIGQALFLKSIWMFEGIRAFGAAIPYVSVEDYDAAVDPKVSNVDESGNYVYIWDKVEADLKEAISKLPADWTSTGEYGRATSWMAKALLGKLYLYWSSPYNGNNGSNPAKLADAKTLLEDVLNNGVDAKGQKYKLAETYSELFAAATSDWTGESIIDIQATLDGSSVMTNSVYSANYTGLNNTNGTGVPTGWGFYQPSYDYVNSMIVDANGLPASDFRSRDVLTKYSEWTEINSEGVEETKKALSTDLTVTVDPRLDITMGRGGVPYLDWGIDPQGAWIRDLPSAGVYVTKKHQTRASELGTYSVTTANSNTKNYHYMRLADVKLMLAEIAIRQGDLETARIHINDIRTRAANDFIEADYTPIIVNTKPYVITKGNYTFENKVKGQTLPNAAGNYCIGLYPAFSSEAEAWTALKRERRAELAFEGHRFYDIARWGEVGTELLNYVTFERQYLSKFSNNPGNFCTMPIPIDELQTAAGRFVQNADWK